MKDSSVMGKVQPVPQTRPAGLRKHRGCATGFNRRATFVLMVAVTLILVSCSPETQIIGLQRPVYTDEESVITLHYFPLEAAAEQYYRNLEVEEYFLFSTPADDAEAVFESIDAETTADGGKTLRFVEDSQESAVDKVLGFIDEQGFMTLVSVHR